MSLFTRKIRTAEHPSLKPSVFLIGCVDARLDTDHDIGFPDGSAYIARSIAAIIPAYDVNDPASVNFSAQLDTAMAGGVKHIVNMGHTHCGGINACACGLEQEKFPNIIQHLKPLEGLKKQLGHAHDEETLRHFERESVRQNIVHLLQYPQVQQAVAAGKLDVNGWVINTATHQISAMSPMDPLADFKPLQPIAEITHNDDALEHVRLKQSNLKKAKEPPAHKPTMAVFADMDASINPRSDFNIHYGDALIYRNNIDINNPSLVTSQLATLEFAAKAHNIKKIVMMGHYDSREPHAKELALEEAKKRFTRLKKVPFIEDDKRIKLSCWYIDVATNHLFKLEEQAPSFRPMSNQKRFDFK